MYMYYLELFSIGVFVVYFPSFRGFETTNPYVGNLRLMPTMCSLFFPNREPLLSHIYVRLPQGHRNSME